MAIDGAAALAGAFEKCSDYEQAFQEYDTSFRSFIEEVQANVVEFGLDVLTPKTEEAIRRRYRRVWLSAQQRYRFSERIDDSLAMIAFFDN